MKAIGIGLESGTGGPEPAYVPRRVEGGKRTTLQSEKDRERKEETPKPFPSHPSENMVPSTGDRAKRE